MSTCLIGVSSLSRELKVRAAHEIMQNAKYYRKTFETSPNYDVAKEVNIALTPEAWGGPTQILALAQVVRRHIVVLGTHIAPHLAGKCKLASCISSRSCRYLHWRYEARDPYDNREHLLLFTPTERPKEKKKGEKPTVSNHFVALLQRPGAVFDNSSFADIANVVPYVSS